jgi:hypothetical protein
LYKRRFYRLTRTEPTRLKSEIALTLKNDKLGEAMELIRWKGPLQRTLYYLKLYTLNYLKKILFSFNLLFLFSCHLDYFNSKPIFFIKLVQVLYLYILYIIYKFWKYFRFSSFSFYIYYSFHIKIYLLSIYICALFLSLELLQRLLKK